MLRKRSKSVGDHRALSVSSSSINSIAQNAAEKQGRLIRMFRSLQRKKDRSDRRSVRLMFALSVISLTVGMATVCVETTSKLKYPRASAAFLWLESVGIFVGCFAMVNGALGIFTWKISSSGHKKCLIGCVQSLSKFNAISSLCAFGLTLIVYGVYSTLRDWQKKLLPYIKVEQNLAHQLGKEELAWPEHVLEELVVIKVVTFSFHVVIFLVSVINSVCCLFNLYINTLPNFTGCAEMISTAGKMLTWSR
ncbi:uncharacterized protein LOC129581405 [Paramacrobiotus metropolitanus]|uniref:uncharacterized protein LOC129581405 n=1 Tax=Paramacrobiotus metropolitanus TaxID=2943436 RepID=UPI002445A183|nr:uncharacterized protein LOC129581405 [Paramacrobiotus metropolitanus]XP_055328415.1 uncharacterized protein LOC129581405 [Paramacrobiotus metropolitanus]